MRWELGNCSFGFCVPGFPGSLQLAFERLKQMALVDCINCGHRVSDKATRCPQCKESPSGTECRRCGKRFPSVEIETIRSFTYDRGCWNNFMQTVSKVRCPECAELVTFSERDVFIFQYRESHPIFDRSGYGVNWAWALCKSPSCPKCGFIDVLQHKGPCSKCYLPIYGAVHEYRTHEYTTFEFEELTADRTVSGC